MGSEGGCGVKPGDLVRYMGSTGILLGPCNPPSLWYIVIMPWGLLDCPSHALEVIGEEEEGSSQVRVRG